MLPLFHFTDRKFKRCVGVFLCFNANKKALETSIELKVVYVVTLIDFYVNLKCCLNQKFYGNIRNKELYFQTQKPNHKAKVVSINILIN